ncbi:MAG: hypothetical protein HHJ14_14375, partial [Cellulomonas sp.]|nr:hypothetical protein [Cellulomonas sp.]
MVRGRILRRPTDAELVQLVVDVEALRTMTWGSAVRGPVHDRRADLHRRAVKVTGSRSMRERRDRHLLALAAPVVQGVSAEDVAAWASVEVRADERAAMLGALGPADPVRDRAELA